LKSVFNARKNFALLSPLPNKITLISTFDTIELSKNQTGKNSSVPFAYAHFMLLKGGKNF